MLKTINVLSFVALLAMQATAQTNGAQALINNIDEKIELKAGTEYFIATERLSVRESENERSRILGVIHLNDRVEVVTTLDSNATLVGVKIKSAANFREGVQSGKTYYIGKKFLTRTDVMRKESPYFVVQNIATEMARVYKKCTVSSNCPHQLVFEAKMVVGKPEEGTENNRNAFKTMLGHSRISEWIKFYQDTNAKYSPWYSKGQAISSIPPQAPKDSKGKPDAGLSWGKSWLEEKDGHSSNYGAFGWYAGKLHPAIGPNGVNFQWLHGTIGWGTDGEAPIELTRSVLLNMFANPGSSGCTRLSNPSIAYLRHLLPVGTDVYRVYARESTRENTCRKNGFFGGCREENIFARYSNQFNPLAWNFTLLTDGPQQSGGVTADTKTLYNMGYTVRPGFNVIEQGVAMIDQYPNAVGSDYRYEPSSGRSGDRYQLDDAYGEQATGFRGTFVVDEGRFIDYQHPANQKIVIGGFREFKSKVPDYLKTNGTFFPAAITHKQKQNNN